MPVEKIAIKSVKRQSPDRWRASEGMVVWFGILLPSQASSLVSNGIDSVVRHTSPLVCSSEKISIRWQYVLGDGPPEEKGTWLRACFSARNDSLLPTYAETARHTS